MHLKALCLCLTLVSSALAINQNAPLVPDARLTPGDVLTSEKNIICKPGYTRTVRNVPQSVKNQVYREYGITSRAPGEFEVDHLISLELGGSNSIKNLWPQSYKTQPLNAHVKDKLENKLHDLACSGAISMQAAQQAIATNWTAAYVKYVGPLPGGASPSTASTTTPAPQAIPVPATPPANPSSAVTPNPDGSCPASAPIKVSRSGIYHLPQGDGSYARTKAQSCFATPADAGSAGYRGVK